MLFFDGCDVSCWCEWHQKYENTDDAYQYIFHHFRKHRHPGHRDFSPPFKNRWEMTLLKLIDTEDLKSKEITRWLIHKFKKHKWGICEQCVMSYTACGSLNLPTCWMWYIRSPPLMYSITKYRRSWQKTNEINITGITDVKAQYPCPQADINPQTDLRADETLCNGHILMATQSVYNPILSN